MNKDENARPRTPTPTGDVDAPHTPIPPPATPVPDMAPTSTSADPAMLLASMQSKAPNARDALGKDTKY